MKKLAIFSAILLLITTFSSCGTTISFTFSQDIDEQTVDGVGIPNCDQLTDLPAISDLLEPISINVESSQEYKENAPKQITEVKMVKLVLRITDTAKSGPDDIDNFNFLKSIKVYAEPTTGDENDKVLIGELDPVPEDATEITINGTGANIIDFLNGDSFKITTDVDGRAPCDDVSFDGYVTIYVKGEL